MESQDKVVLLTYNQIQKMAEIQNQILCFQEEKDLQAHKQMEIINPQYKLRRYWNNHWLNSDKIKFITFIKRNKRLFREEFQTKKSKFYHALQKAVQTKSLIQLRYHFQSLYEYFDRNIDKFVVQYQQLLGVRISPKSEQKQHICKQLKLDLSPQEKAQVHREFIQQMLQLAERYNIPKQKRRDPEDIVDLDEVYEQFRAKINKQNQEKAALKLISSSEKKQDNDGISKDDENDKFNIEKNI